MKIILASASPRRQELLKQIARSFQVVASGVDEARLKAASPRLLARKAALMKAQAVANKHKDSIVIGADTIVVLGKHILGKPKNNSAAFLMLKSLTGKTHQVITGIAVVFPGGKIVSDSAVTRVKMKRVSDQQILDYVKTGRPLDKAGAYGIQEIEAIFVDKIAGDYDNVVGLPLRQLSKLLAGKK